MFECLQDDATPSSGLQPEAPMQQVLAMLLPQGNEPVPSHQQQQQQQQQDRGEAQSTPRLTPTHAADQAVSSSSLSSAAAEEPALGHAALLQPQVSTHVGESFHPVQAIEYAARQAYSVQSLLRMLMQQCN